MVSCRRIFIVVKMRHSVVLGYLTVCLLGGSILNYIFLAVGNKRRGNATYEWRRKKLDGLSEEETTACRFPSRF